MALRGRSNTVKLAIIVFLSCTVAYGLALTGPLFFDDFPNLLDNKRLQIDGATFDDWRVAILSSDAGTLLRPVAMLTFAINHAVVGEFSPFSLKATNLAIHLIVGIFVYLLAWMVLQSPALRAYQLSPQRRWVVALIAASIWILHPIHVSTVLYAIQRMAQLSTMFTLAGILVFMHFRLRWAVSGATPGEFLAAALWILLLGVCALLSKENGALLPWLLGVIEVTLFLGMWRGREQGKVLWLGRLLLLLPVLVLVSVYFIVPDMLYAPYGGRNFTLSERLLTQGRALWQYVSWMLVPNITGMGFFHDDIVISRSFWSPITTATSIFAWVFVLGACLLWYRRYPMIAFAFLFYLVAHSMESTVLPLEMVFEHRNYLASVGFAVLAALGIVMSVARIDRLRLRTVVAGILSVLVALLLVRTSAWTDEISLARHNVVNHPQSARANFFYANALFKRFGRAQELGLGEEEKKALAVTSRRYFEKMHSIDEHAFAATVMLYQLDTRYFPGLAQKNDWLEVITNSSKTHRLQSSDISALGALVEFSMTPEASENGVRIEGILQQLAASDPNSLKLLYLQYSYLIGAESAERSNLLPMLRQALLVHPNNRQPPALLAQYYGNDDLVKTYESIQEWMRRDQFRRELPVIREIFNQ